MDISSSSPSSSREDVVVVDFVVDSDVISDFPESSSSESAKLKRKTEKLELNLSSRFAFSVVVVIRGIGTPDPDGLTPSSAGEFLTSLNLVPNKFNLVAGLFWMLVENLDEL